MYSDSPVNNTKDDKLGRYLIAQEIANGLSKSFKNNTESIVLGINGAWGSGKSSLINFIINEIEKLSEDSNNDIIILRFNPWMFSGQNELQSIFFKELFLKLESKKGKLKKASKRLADLLTHLNWLKYIHSGAGDVIKDSKEFLEGLNKEKDLSVIKFELDDLLIKSAVKLYITIDDIDRLSPEEITNIFQLVKLNGNFANTIFILAYDNEVVTDALRQKFGENGKRYIEKIVQIDYTLPNASRVDILRILEDSLLNLFEDENLISKLTHSFPNFKKEKFTELFTSIRDIYRYNNGVKLRLSSIYQELNIRDFLLVEALRVFRHDAYKLIIENKNKLTQRDSRDRVLIIDRNHEIETVDQVINKIAKDDITKHLMNDLFVLDESFNRYSSEDLIREQRVGNSNYFDRYFNLQLSNFDIQEKVFTNFIQSLNTEDRVEILMTVAQKGQLFQFINCVEIKIDNTIVRINLIIVSILKFSESIHYDFERSMNDSDFLTSMRFCSRLLSKLENTEARRQIITQYTNQTPGSVTFTSIHLCANIIRSKDMFANNQLNSNHMWHSLFSVEEIANDDFVKTLSKRYNEGIKNLFIRASTEPKLLNGDELFFVLEDLKRLHSDFYDSEFPEFIRDNEILLTVLLMCITSRYISMNGNVGFSLGQSQLFPKMNIEEIKERFDEIKIETLTNEQKGTVNFFNQAYKDNFLEKRYYNFETLAHFDAT